MLNSVANFGPVKISEHLTHLICTRNTSYANQSVGG